MLVYSNTFVEGVMTIISDVKKLSNQVLYVLLKSKVQEERNLTLEIIGLLREVRSRRLHLERGYESFHQYCVKELKYDDGSAHRRIKALDLVTQIPEIIQSIESGALSLTTASQVQNFFNQEAKKDKTYSKVDKIKLLTSLESKSKREIEKTLMTLAPETIKQAEKIKYISETHLKLELVINEQLMKKLERLKNLTSHKNATMTDLIEALVDEALKKKDPELKLKNKNIECRKANIEKMKVEKANIETINVEISNADLSNECSTSSSDNSGLQIITQNNLFTKTPPERVLKVMAASPEKLKLKAKSRYIPSHVKD